MSAIRRLYLDIDGVLNATAPGRLVGSWPRYLDAVITARGMDGEVHPYPFHVVPEVLEAVRAWHADGVEIVHVSTWREQAHLVDEAFDLPVFPSLDLAEEGFWLDTAKLPAVRAHLAEHPADVVVWIDDHLSTYAAIDARAWAENAEVHIIAPEAVSGLRKKDLRAIARLLEVR